MYDYDNKFLKESYSPIKNTKSHVHYGTGICSKSEILLSYPNGPLFALNITSIKKWFIENDSSPHCCKQKIYLDGYNIKDPTMNHSCVRVSSNKCVQITASYNNHDNQVHIRWIIITDTGSVIMRFYPQKYCIYWNYYYLQDNQCNTKKP